MVRSIRSFALLVALVPVGCTFYAEGKVDPDEPPARPYPPGRQDPAPPPRGGSDGHDAGRPATGYGASPDAAVAPPDARPAPSSCPGRAVDRWKELLIIDRSVMADALARNESADAPWSFRRRLEDLAGGTDRAAELAYAWLGQWRSLTSVSISAGAPSGARVAVIPRPTVDGELLCPWLRLTPANGCVAGCATCVDRRLDLLQAPFRLIAIVNRADLARGDGACGRDGGELRFVYTAVRPDTRASLPFTVIFEYRVTLPAGEDGRSWAGAWRALGLVPFGPGFNAGLAALTDRALAGATLARVQTNEVALGLPLGMPWEMRQFSPLPLDNGGMALEPSAAVHTPRLSLNDSEELAAWLEQNRRAILEGDNLLRPDMLAGSALIPTADFAWRAPGADPAVLVAFNANSCNGCHGGRRDPADLPFQHVGPAEGSYYDPTAATAPARVSKFLHNPGREDELGRRAAVLQATACASCGDYPRPFP
jgi:hypothetical protein